MGEIYREEKTDTTVINYSVPISDKMIEHILCSAFEGGSNYWANNVSFHNKEDGKKIGGWKHKYLTTTKLKDAKLIVHTNSGGQVAFSKKSIIEGLQMMDDPKNGCTKALKRLLFGDWDAWDADIAFQMACFKEVVYG